MSTFRARQQNTETKFVSSRGVIGQFRHCYVVAVANLEVVLLEADLKDKSVSVLTIGTDTVAEPYTDEERHPVEIDAIVEIVETCLILINEVG